MNTLVRHLRLLFLVVLALCTITASAKADTVLYTDGAASGAIYGTPLISNGYQVEDSFALSSASTLTSITFGAWLSGSSTAQSIDWTIVGSEGSQTPVCSDCSGTASLTQTFDFINSYGYSIDDETFSLPDVSLSAGTYWLELQNGFNDLGMGVYWDLNAGPSMAWVSWPDGLSGDVSGTNCGLGPGQCSNSFTIYGTTDTAPTPEPSSLALLGSGVLLLGAEIRRRYRTIR